MLFKPNRQKKGTDRKKARKKASEWMFRRKGSEEEGGEGGSLSRD